MNFIYKLGTSLKVISFILLMTYPCIVHSQTEVDSILLYKEHVLLNNRMIELETKQEALEQMIGNLESFFAGGIFILVFLSTIPVFQQILTSRKDKKDYESRFNHMKEDSARSFALLEEQGKRYEDFIKDQGELNQKLLKTTQENITQITALLGSLQQVFAFADKANDLKDEIDRIIDEEKQKKQEEQNRELLAAKTINLEAMEICESGINRSNFRKNLQKLRSIRGSITSFITEDSSRRRLLNANAFYLLGLEYYLRSLFSESIKLFDEAITLAKKYTTEEAPDYLYPYPSKNKEDIKKWNKKLVNICLSQKGATIYNLGQYADAERLFREAVLDYDNKDVASMLYELEAKYLGGEEKFEALTTAFEATKRKIENITDVRGWRETKEEILAQLYVKYGNCYYPSKHKKIYPKKNNLMKAENYFKKAFEFHPNYISKFSYAQTLALKSKRGISLAEKEKAQKMAAKLFSEVLNEIKLKFGPASQDGKLLIMLYYMYLICCFEGGLEEESITRYISKIYEEGSSLPQAKEYNIFIFSPLSKCDLTFDELREELELLKKELELKV